MSTDSYRAGLWILLGLLVMLGLWALIIGAGYLGWWISQ